MSPRLLRFIISLLGAKSGVYIPRVQDYLIRLSYMSHNAWTAVAMKSMEYFAMIRTQSAIDDNMPFFFFQETCESILMQQLRKKAFQNP